MPVATLLLREPAVTSLTSIVEKSQHRKAPLPEFDLRLNSCQLDFVLITEPDCRPKIAPSAADEGFESDIDTLSIVSSDDSFTSAHLQENGAKIQETDSANGSASSDSDTETPRPPPETASPPSPPPPSSSSEGGTNESHHLVDCMCYTDIKFPNVLVFVVKGDALVFRFGDLEALRSFYTNFSTFKAIANQKAYGGKNYGAKFNLLQRTDKNGVTHIEITKGPETGRPPFAGLQKREPSSIISLNTPETDYFRNKTAPPPDPFSHNSSSNSNSGTHKESRSNSKDAANSRQRSESPAAVINDAQSRKECNGNPKNSHSSKVGITNAPSSQRCASTENILDLQSLSREAAAAAAAENKNESVAVLKKVWNSAEDLLDSPKRPERRRKIKPKAPPPPTSSDNPNILRGSYVRVNVSSSDIKQSENAVALGKPKEGHSRLQTFAQKMLPPMPRDYSLTLAKPRELTFQQFKYVEPKRSEMVLQNRLNSEQHSWTYSVPRFLRKPRSHSETRNFTPMAYRYIDTTQTKFYYPDKAEASSNVSNRLFGMSSKLKDFSTVNSSTVSRRYENWDSRNDIRRSSLGELTYKINNTGGSLKSVIKKDDNKRRNNEKKVTFSAYTTVQVV